MVKNFGHTLHTVGALSFKTCHRSFSLENAVSLTSSHAAEPCCITMTQECPALLRKPPQSNNSLGEGKVEKRGDGGSVYVCVREEGGQTKGNLITPGHGSSTSQQREIHHLQDQTETCAQGKAQWKLYPTHPKALSPPSLSPFFTHCNLLLLHLLFHLHLSDSHQRQRASFRHTLWNPTQVRMFSGPNDLKALTSLIAHWWYIPVLLPSVGSRTLSWLLHPHFANIKLQSSSIGHACWNVMGYWRTNHYFSLSCLHQVMYYTNLLNLCFPQKYCCCNKHFDRLNCCYYCRWVGLAMLHCKWTHYHMFLAGTFRQKSVYSTAYCLYCINVDTCKRMAYGNGNNSMHQHKAWHV